jgi:uncharacterized protein GlcG (DUF336 family)
MSSVRNHWQTAAASAVFAISLSMAPAYSQVSESGYSLPLSLAVEAAQEAIRACAATGYPVVATVVDVAGITKASLRGDHSTIHTRETAFRKAYTAVTLGPIFKADTTSLLAKTVGASSGAPSFLTVPNIIFLPGAVVIKNGEEIVGAIGVGGSPGGDKDEVCAQAGVAKIRDRVK